MINEILKEKIIYEMHFQATRSSGKGGQNVNKVSSKIILSFDLINSVTLNEVQRELFIEYLGNRVTKKGTLHISSSKERSQYMNKKNSIEKFFRLLEQALIPKEERIATKPSKSSKEKRLKDKAFRAEKKGGRKIKIQLEE